MTDETDSVTRRSECDLHADRELLVLYTDDAPARPGNEPQPGDRQWQMCLPLSDGRRLHLLMGRRSHRAFSDMLAAEATDDAEDER